MIIEIRTSTGKLVSILECERQDTYNEGVAFGLLSDLLRYTDREQTFTVKVAKTSP